ncbi:hypothetical protein DMC30DRAFT_191417 [Rhodotorula diobovata]|uniref:Uncharacterized protein n=1 Tax=Rhodotorula diobovata TaxID=5288 RepID=A0A5C5G746_9BASI|nr:hypothetical protein DMC30DRAFT_191417 [Rhodotorula diobovata]
MDIRKSHNPILNSALTEPRWRVRGKATTHGTRLISAVRATRARSCLTVVFLACVLLIRDGQNEGGAGLASRGKSRVLKELAQRLCLSPLRATSPHSLLPPESRTSPGPVRSTCGSPVVPRSLVLALSLPPPAQPAAAPAAFPLRRGPLEVLGVLHARGSVGSCAASVRRAPRACEREREGEGRGQLAHLLDEPQRLDPLPRKPRDPAASSVPCRRRGDVAPPPVRLAAPPGRECVPGGGGVGGRGRAGECRVGVVSSLERPEAGVEGEEVGEVGEAWRRRVEVSRGEGQAGSERESESQARGGGNDAHLAETRSRRLSGAVRGLEPRVSRAPHVRGARKRGVPAHAP